MGATVVPRAAPVLDIHAHRYDPVVLHAREVLSRDGLTIADVTCRNRPGAGDADEYIGAHALVFVRRGCFVRTSDGVGTVMDPTLAYCMAPGEESRYDHPHADGDDCTYLSFAPALAASLWGGDPGLPSGALPTSIAIDLEHRLLLADARAGADPDELEERAIVLAAQTLEQADPRRVASGRPSTARARTALADGVREALVADPGRSLPELAAALATSPHHLSRLFAASTGHTISRHRMRLRARAALERLAAGEGDLARLAADVGFADQSHMCRVIRSETGHTPAALRESLARD